MPEKLQPTVSIIIKALNEERHIAAAIESALAALGGIDGEVILADGGSRDRIHPPEEPCLVVHRATPREDP